MVHLAAIGSAAHHCVAAEGPQPVQRHVQFVAEVDLVHHRRQQGVALPVVEAAVEQGSLAEGIHPVGDGAGSEDAPSGKVLAQPARFLVFDGGADVDGLFHAPGDAPLVQDNRRREQQQCRQDDPWPGNPDRSRGQRRYQPERQVQFQVIALRLRDQREVEPGRSQPDGRHAPQEQQREAQARGGNPAPQPGLPAPGPRPAR